MRISLFKIVELSQLGDEDLEEEVLKLSEESGRAWYGTAKATIRISLLNKGDRLIISEVLHKLKKEVEDKIGNASVKNCSINALTSYQLTDMPSFYSLNKLKKIVVSKIDTKVNDININVNPDLVYGIEINDIHYAGGIKFNIAQKRNLTPKQRVLAADILYLNLNSHPKLKAYKVLPEFCVCLDVFQKLASVSKLKEDSDHIPILDELTKYISKYGLGF